MVVDRISVRGGWSLPFFLTSSTISTHCNLSSPGHYKRQLVLFHSWNSGAIYPLSFGLPPVAKPQPPNIFWAYKRLSWLTWALMSHDRIFLCQDFIMSDAGLSVFFYTISAWKQPFCVHYNRSHISIASFVPHNRTDDLLTISVITAPKMTF